MLYIQKKNEPEAVIKWKRKYKGTPPFETIPEKEKHLLRDSLLKEQGNICCYCCGRISANDSHIEHFHPKSKYPKLSLEYQNLFASCNGGPYKKHCGQYKDNNFDEKTLISPLEPDCADYFIFNEFGKIMPADDGDVRAQYTIDTLSLNEPRLKKAREAAYWAALEEDEDLRNPGSEARRQELIQKFNTIPEDGKQIPYSDLILYFLRKG